VTHMDDIQLLPSLGECPPRAEMKECTRTLSQVLQARLKLRDPRRGYLDVVFGFPAAKGSDQIAVLSANDHTAMPSEFPGHRRTHLATAIF
jgi:hypothetical protein